MCNCENIIVGIMQAGLENVLRTGFSLNTKIYKRSGVYNQLCRLLVSFFFFLGEEIGSQLVVYFVIQIIHKGQVYMFLQNNATQKKTIFWHNLF